MAIRYKAWAFAAISCLFAAPAMADADDSEGAYVYITGGEGLAYNACKAPLIPAGSQCSQMNLIFRGGVGYQYTPTWGLEASYGQFGRADSSGFAAFKAPAGAGAYQWVLKANGLAVQAVATLHMGDTVSVFGKFGVARVEFDESLTAVTGTGYWYFTPAVQYNHNVAALGAGVRFDVGPHGSLLFMGESFGSHDVYGVYGITSRVRLVTGSMGLMYRY